MADPTDDQTDDQTSDPTDDRTRLTGPQILAEGLDDWRQLLGTLQTRWQTGDFVTGAALVAGITAAAEESQHHPDLDLRYPHLDVVLTSHDVGGLTRRDVRLARRISALAAERGVRADPASVTAVELALDTADAARLLPFWAAVLGLDPDHGRPDEVVDPAGRLPSLWFQDTEEHEEPRQRFHLDVHVPHDVVDDRIAAALAAGGTLVSDDEAPSFWVLADADGNKACLCTWQDRD